MTDEQIEIGKALGHVTYVPGTSQKRFGRNMAFLAEHSPEREISEAQDRYMRILAYRFRRQMPDHLIPAEKPA